MASELLGDGTGHHWRFAPYGTGASCGGFSSTLPGEAPSVAGGQLSRSAPLEETGLHGERGCQFTGHRIWARLLLLHMSDFRLRNDWVHSSGIRLLSQGLGFGIFRGPTAKKIQTDRRSLGLFLSHRKAPKMGAVKQAEA